MTANGRGNNLTPHRQLPRRTRREIRQILRRDVMPLRRQHHIVVEPHTQIPLPIHEQPHSPPLQPGAVRLLQREHQTPRPQEPRLPTPPTAQGTGGRMGVVRESEDVLSTRLRSSLCELPVWLVRVLRDAGCFCPDRRSAVDRSSELKESVPHLFPGGRGRRCRCSPSTWQRRSRPVRRRRRRCRVLGTAVRRGLKRGPIRVGRSWCPLPGWVSWGAKCRRARSVPCPPALARVRRG